jgi:hypothetical protein
MKMAEFSTTLQGILLFNVTIAGNQERRSDHLAHREGNLGPLNSHAR